MKVAPANPAPAMFVTLLKSTPVKFDHPNQIPEISFGKIAFSRFPISDDGIEATFLKSNPTNVEPKSKIPAPDKLTPDKLTPDRAPSLKNAPDKLTPDKLTPDRAPAPMNP